ncbi:subtilisin-like serine protease precursor [Meredithblackwellia eburnea MCA 4105]
MRIVSLLVAALSAGNHVVSATPSFNNNSSNIVPNLYIVQMDTGALLKRGLSLGNIVSDVLTQITKSGCSYTVQQKFSSMPNLFSGASIKVKDGTTQADLLKIPGVKKVWPVRKYGRPQAEKTSDGGNGFLGGAPTTAADLLAAAVPVPGFSAWNVTPAEVYGAGWNLNSQGVDDSDDDDSDDDDYGNQNSTSRRAARRALVRKRATSDYATDGYGAHVQIGVDKTHAAGQLGSGQLVCLLDTGIDYLNPLLGGCFGSGCHVSVGYDLVGDNYNGDNTPVPDSDPYVTCDSHGTFQSGIIGAIANSYGFTGVAPQANLGMYRVFGCSGTVTDDVVLQAYTMAMKAGCNVINISLGGSAGWLDNTPTEMLIESAAAQGIFTSTSAGNSGGEGIFFSNQPASTLAGVSTASVYVQGMAGYNATVLGFDPVQYLSIKPFNATGSSYRVYFTSTDINGGATDACSAIPASVGSLANYIVVVQRGGCAFTTKQANVVAAGGTMMLMYNNAAAAQQFYLDASGTGLNALATMRFQDGQQLLNLYLQTNGRLLVKFPSSGLVPGIIDTIQGGLMQGDTEFGPTLDMYLQPSFAAPGVNILSTMSLASGGLGISAGTSIASPFVAGAAAVIKAARSSESLTVSQIKGLLSTTTQLITNSRSGYGYNPVNRQGAGLMQVNVAMSAKTFITPYNILLNDTANLNNVQTIKITNQNSYATLYTFSSALGSAYGIYSSSSTILPTTSPVNVTNAMASVSFSRTRIQVAAGASSTITVTITPPTLSASDAALYPVYNGWVIISGAPVSGSGTQESYNVPYFGLSGSLINVPIIDTTTTIYGPGYAYPLLIGSNQDIQLQSANYALGSGPLAVVRLAMGTPLLTIDLVLANISFTGTISTNNNGATSREKRGHRDMVLHEHGGAKRMVQARATRQLYTDIPLVGNIYTAPYQPRDCFTCSTGFDQEIQVTGSYTNSAGVKKTASKNVAYRLLIRAAKITGDLRYEDQYESWVSPSFTYTS